MKIVLHCTYVEVVSQGRGKPKQQVTRQAGTIIDLPKGEAESLIERELAVMAEPEAEVPEPEADEPDQEAEGTDPDPEPGAEAPAAKKAGK